MALIVAGEALVDLAPANDALAPLPGGSAYNVAIGLARLGVRVRYLGPLSRDGFGDVLVRHLTDEQVDLGLAPRTDRPTTLAVVHLDRAGRGSYRFYLEGTSAIRFDEAEIAALPHADAVHVSFGAVTAETRPAGRTLIRLLNEQPRTRFTSLDPNVRPEAIADLRSYARRLDAVIRDLDLVKVSDEDLQALDRSGGDPLRRARAWARAGPVLTVVTRGAEGVVVYRPDGRHLELPAERVEVVDTIGAGDAFTAALLAGFDRRGLLSRSTIAELDDTTLEHVLRGAVHAAAISCGRAGADPPRSHEI